MYINYDNNYMNPGYSAYSRMAGSTPGYMGLPAGCPLMNRQGINPNGVMGQGCPMMYSAMQYPNTTPVYNNAYGDYNPMARDNFTAPVGQCINNPVEPSAMPPMGFMPGMVSMRAVSIKDIQD